MGGLARRTRFLAYIMVLFIRMPLVTFKYLGVILHLTVYIQGNKLTIYKLKSYTSILSIIKDFQFQDSFNGLMLEPSKEAEVELTCQDEAWRIFEEADDKKIPRKVTEVSCILVDSPIEKEDDFEKVHAGNDIV